MVSFLPGHGLAGNDRKASRFAYVSPGYFDTLKIPIRSGRDFDDLDNARSQRVMLVNESFVRESSWRTNPIGATLRTHCGTGFSGDDLRNRRRGRRHEVRGSARRELLVRYGGTGRWPPIAYVPIAQNPSPYAWAPVIVRSSTVVPGITAAIAQRVTQLNPAIAMQFIELKTQVRERLVANG